MAVTVSFTPAAIFPAAGKNERQVFAMRGWLQKQSPSKLKGLQRRFFVLDEARDLSYYKSDTDMAKGVAPKGVIPLSQLRSVRRTPGALSFDLDVGYRTFTLVARTEAELASWLRAIDPGVAAGGVGGAKPPGPGPGPSSPSEQPSESANPFGAASPESSLEAGASAPLDDAPPGAPTPAVPGVLLAAWLLKSPPNLSLRRMNETKRLQSRWFVLTGRSLAYYSNEGDASTPLGAVHLDSITLCEPKGAGKHAGKFYVHTASRQFKLVAPNEPAMRSWVGAINAARAALNDKQRERATSLWSASDPRSLRMSIAQQPQ